MENLDLDIDDDTIDEKPSKAITVEQFRLGLKVFVGLISIVIVIAFFIFNQPYQSYISRLRY